MVVDSKETIGAIRLIEYFGGDNDSLFARIANSDQRFIHLQTIFTKCIEITIFTVFGDFKLWWRAEKSNTFATRLYQILHCRKSTGIVVHHHTVGVNTNTYTIEKNQWNITFNNLLKMIVICGMLCQRSQHPRHTGSYQRTGITHLFLVTLVRLTNNHIITFIISNLLYTRKN